MSQDKTTCFNFRMGLNVHCETPERFAQSAKRSYKCQECQRLDGKLKNCLRCDVKFQPKCERLFMCNECFIKNKVSWDSTR